MPSLHELLTGPGKRQRAIADVERLIDDEMRQKSGLRAMPLKAGYKMVKGLRPGFIRSSVDHLLDEFCGVLDPHYQDWAKDAQGTFADFLRRRSGRAADSVLGVTDRRADRSSNRALVKAYKKLRGVAKGHVEKALPGVGRMIEPYHREIAAKS